jgi:hypothetical protein
VLPPEKLEQREQAFRIYRDMGRARSLSLLEKELKQHYPEIAVSRITLEKWSHAHEWQDRVKAHDKAVGDAIPQKEMSPEFDQVDKLMSAAHLALTRALSGKPSITKASDMKALIDASANALKLADSIRDKKGNDKGGELVVAEMERVLSAVAQRRRQDAVDTMLAFGIPVAAMRKMGLTDADGLPSVDLGVEPAKPDVEVTGELEAIAETAEKLDGARQPQLDRSPASALVRRLRVTPPRSQLYPRKP